MILETKLTLPQPKAGALLRTGLIDLIKNNLDKKLILITADAGYGKTTLLGQLVKSAALPCVFYSLDQADGDLAPFYAHLIHGLEKIDANIVKRCRGLLDQGGEGLKNGELLMGTLINELFEKRKEELFFIMDDYQHLAEDSQVYNALNYFIDHIPDTVHVIIASRRVVQLFSLAKWVAKQDAFALTKENLAFTRDELRDLLSKAYSPNASEDELKKLLEHTEGWITGIQMILSQSLGQEHRRTIRETLANYLQTNPRGEDMFGYFANEIIANETERVKDFLIRSSVLETLTDEACNAVLGIGDSSSMLNVLEKRHLFISELGNGQYRYHRLFQEFLQKQNDRGKCRALNLKAAEYYHGTGDVMPAIDHFIAAGEYRPAINSILENISDIMKRAQFTLLDNWLQLLPDETLLYDPTIIYYRGQMYQAQNRMKEAEEQYALSDETMKKRIPMEHGKKRQYLSLHRALSLMSISQLRFFNGQYREALAALNKAQRICPSSHKAEKSSFLNTTGLIWQAMGYLKKAQSCFAKAIAIDNIYGKEQLYMLYRKSNMAFVYFKQGEMRASFELYESLIKMFDKQYSLYRGVIYANAANTAMVMGQTDWAGKCLHEAMELCRGYEDILSHAVLYNSLGSLCIYREEWEAAARHLGKAVEELKKTNWKNAEIKAFYNIIRLHRYQGNRQQAEEYIAKTKKTEGDMDAILRLDLQIEGAFCGLWRREWDSAEELLKAAERQAVKNGYSYEIFLAKLGLASVYWGKGRKKPAKATFSKAVSLARRKGYDGALMLDVRHNSGLHQLLMEIKTDKNYVDVIKGRMCQAGADFLEQHKISARMFGNLRIILSDGREIPLKWRSLKSASLFAYLLLHRDRLCNREELMNALWPRVSTIRAGHNLRDSVYWLKKTMDCGLHQAGKSGTTALSLIEHHDKGYGINKDCPVWLDIEEFQKIWGNSRKSEAAGNAGESLQDYCRCIELYNDDFLPNLGEWWCEEYRARYQKMFLFALHQLAMAAANSRDYTQSADYYRRYLGREPYFEEARIGLWSALKALGKQAEIRKDYYDYCRLLKKEMREKVPEKVKQVYQSMTFSDGT